jgi:hypothetical protein
MQERASYETVSTYSKRGVHDIRHRVVSHVVPRIPRYHNLVPAKVQPDVQGHKAQERREKPWTRQIPGSPPPLRVEGCAVLRSRQPKGIDGDAPHDSLVRVSSRIRSSWLSGSPVKEVGGKAMVFPSVPGYWLNGAATVTINAARDILRVDCPERCLRQTGRSEVRLWGSTCSGGGGGIGNAGAAIGHDFALTKGLSIAAAKDRRRGQRKKKTEGCFSAACPLRACYCCCCSFLSFLGLLLLPRFRAHIAASQRSRRLVLDARAPRHCNWPTAAHHERHSVCRRPERLHIAGRRMHKAHRNTARGKPRGRCGTALARVRMPPSAWTDKC